MPPKQHRKIVTDPGEYLAQMLVSRPVGGLLLMLTIARVSVVIPSFAAPPRLSELVDWSFSGVHGREA